MDMSQLNSPYREFLANEIQNNSEVLAQHWLDSLKKIVLEDSRDIFPTEEYLDHIPTMINEIGKIVSSQDVDLALFNSLISRKAIELGNLRHQQNATVNQLLREYDLLAHHLECFLAEVSNNYSLPLEPAEMMLASNTIHAIVRRILQDTADSFVSRFVETIDEQTEKLLHYNNFIGHEIRTPLQTALLNVELMIEEKADSGEESKDELTDVKAAVQQVIMIINNVDSLVNPTKPATMETPVTQEVGVAELVSDIGYQLRHTLTEKNVRLDIAAELGVVTTDTGKLRLILSNLLSNSVKYSDPNKPDSFVRVVREDNSGGRASISVADNGIGISAQLLPKVKKLKVRAYDAHGAEEPVDGHGIGLFLADEAAQFLNGHLSIESTQNEGTTVTIDIPEHP